ncbi:MAG: hypothetical protein KAS62_11165, partial [Candidatus Delongbacteria bacterium]|nr:hypothetical protein [Candidatus Delongbacteria bacterium]
MKRSIVLVTVLLYSIVILAELINVNPDPNGDKWLAGGFLIPSDAELAKIKEFKPLNKISKVLPSRVDNSTEPYFRPIFNQVGGSCAQASGIGYTFTYEINRARDLVANTTDTQYPTHFTYNFLNGGTGNNGSWYGTGWDIIALGGCPNVTDYGGSFAEGGNSRWLSGLDEWENGLSNRVSDHTYIGIDTPEGLDEFKNWFDNHSDGSQSGGIGVFATGATGYTMTILPAGTHEAGKKVITRWGSVMNHAMTYVGYDDSVRFDYNSDGRFTNDIDINGDRVIDMRDWEIGALIVANSWGSGWGDGGFAYQMYKVIAEDEDDGGVYLGRTDIVHIISDYSPEFVMKAKIKHTQRNMFKVYAGISGDITDEQPRIYHDFRLLSFQGGDFYPKGGSTEDDKYLDFTLDVTDLLSNVDTSAPFNLYFMILEEDNGNMLEGEVISVTVVNKSNGKEYYGADTNIEMINDGMTTIPVLIDANIFRPSNVRAFGFDGKVSLSWDGNLVKSTSFENYKIYRNGIPVISDLVDSEYVDEDVVNGTLYTYEIAAVFSGDFTGEILSGPIQSMPSEPMMLPYYEDFEAGNGAWNFKNDISGWNLTDDSFSSSDCDLSGNITQFIAANSDLAGDGIYVLDYAISPLFNLSSYSNVQLSFDYILDNNPSHPTYAADMVLLYRTSDESEWITLSDMADISTWTDFSISLPEEALMSNSTRLAFLFDDHNLWSFGGAFDNIEITGDLNSSSPVITEYYPLESELIFDEAISQEFSIVVEDLDTGSSELIYNWYLNGDLIESGTNIRSINFAEFGIHEVKAVVSDKFTEDFVIWSVDFTSIEENIPMVTQLYQNYPNPFNPQTTIRFDLQKDDNVVMKIYDTNGRLVKTLLDSF